MNKVIFVSLVCFGLEITAQQKISKSYSVFPTTSQEESSRILFPSFVVHGFQPTNGAAKYMPRKMVGNGDAVVTPGLGLEFLNSEGVLLMTAVVKDCYDNWAGTLQVGEEFKISRRANWAWSMGFYIRQTPNFCEADGRSFENCDLKDSLSVPFARNMNGKWVDVIPLPFLHYGYTVYKDRDLQVNFKLLANFFINEVGIEVPF